MDIIPSINLNCYELIKQIGQGSFGKVYLIKEKLTGDLFAAKETEKDYSSSEIQSFYKEINSLSRVNNHSVLKIYGYSLTNFDHFDNPVIITEYMPNGSLDKFFKKRICPLTPTQRYIILLGIAIGMKYLHSQGIIHRDLKPSNILLDSNFHPYICDFGFSRISDISVTQFVMSTVGGTPLYEAPEILKEDPYTYKIDIYSFSFIAYELITCQRPLTGYKSIHKLVTAIINEKRPDTSTIQSYEISSFLRRCWSNTPSIRPSFDEIVYTILSEEFIKYFNVSIEKVNEYLSNFDRKLIKKIELDKLISSLIKDDNAESFFRLAVMYDEGEEGIEVDKEKACKYYQKACDLGNADAMHIYGHKLIKGENGIQQNKEKAAVLYKKFVDMGNLKAMYNYGLMLFLGDGIKCDKEAAAVYFKKSADEGNPKSMLIYGDMLYNGDGVRKNKKVAARYYAKLSQLGTSSAALKYTIMLLMGDGINQNKKMAAFHMKKSSDFGNVIASFNYGAMLFNGDGVPVDKKKSLYYIKYASKHGFDKAVDFLKKNFNIEEIKEFDELSKTLTEEEIKSRLNDFNFTDFSIFIKRITCHLFLNIIKQYNIRTNSMDTADLILYDGILSTPKYVNYNPSKHVSKIPGFYKLINKSNFFTSLNNFILKYPGDYKKFIPLTFILPHEKELFIQNIKASKFWVLQCKVDNKNKYKLINNISDLDGYDDNNLCNVQQYISPYLIDNHKVELRVFVMISNLDPLTFFIYKEGLAYLADDEYIEPKSTNKDSYSFDFIFSPTSKIDQIRPLQSIVEIFSSDYSSFWKEIEQICALSILSILDDLRKVALEASALNDKTIEGKFKKISPLNRFYNLISIGLLIDKDGNPFISRIHNNPGMKPLSEFDEKFKCKLINSEYKLFAALLDKTPSKISNWKKFSLESDSAVIAFLSNENTKVTPVVPRSLSRRGTKPLPKVESKPTKSETKSSSDESKPTKSETKSSFYESKQKDKK